MSSPADYEHRGFSSAPPEPPTQRVSIMGGARQASTPQEASTQALPQGWAEGPQAEQWATQALPQGWAEDPQAEQWSQPATDVLPTSVPPPAAVPRTSVLPTTRTPHAAGPQTSVLPAGGAGDWATSGPGPAVPGRDVPVPPVSPAPQARPEPAPRPRRPRAPKRRSAALPIGTLLLIAAVVLLAWGVYTLLVSIDVLDIVLNGAQTVDLVAAGAMAAGAVLAFLAFIAAIAAVVRSRPRFAAGLLLLGTIILPTAAVLGAGYYGGTILKDRTLAEADQYTGQIDAAQVQQVEDVLDQVEATGVQVPWRDELLEILGTVSSGQ
ncbi:MAG: hypothetical protein Q4C85_04335 [Actinomyces sp.]|uniref:hypothetical protein n=1 Tax=Actinomyces sp. TaxID=29317 RepID=UPI0026DB98BD|nr:hypothetical protein [Actinomyces sp.]MDO4242977.1 hypothetical protein [Actinomyces sp.]